MTDRPHVSAVIVNYRRYDLLADCLASLAASSRPPDTVIVVDNESDADPLARALTAFPGAIGLANAGNPGYAATCNQGWRAAPPGVVLFLNADVTLDVGCMAVCLDALMADPGVGIVTARLVRPDGRLDHACHRGIPTPGAALWYALRLHRVRPRSRHFARYTMSWLDPQTDHDVEACSGAFLMAQTSTLDRLGGWDEAYWFYAEDLDLCLRVAQDGLRVWFVGTARAVHVKGASSHLRDADAGLSRADLAAKRRVKGAIAASHERFYHKHLESTTALPFRLALNMWFAVERWRSSVARR